MVGLKEEEYGCDSKKDRQLESDHGGIESLEVPTSKLPLANG
mgnify:CR=1 FL=1